MRLRQVKKMKIETLKESLRGKKINKFRPKREN